MIKKFNAINVSSKIAICGLPIRADTYKTCSFGCEYCFANNREIMKFEDNLCVADIQAVERTLYRILIDKDIKKDKLLDVLIANGYDWHLGGMSDPLQPIEKELKITKQLLEITNKYGIHILISTKSDSVYECNIRPDLQSFQLSVTNTYNRKDIEPKVPDIEKRYKFYRQLKDDGFKVGIRIQPLIPGISTTEIIDMFHDADNFTIEGIKLIPQNEEHKKRCLEVTGLKREQFKQQGLLALEPEYRLEVYKPFIEKLEQMKIPYSIADNDLRYLGTNSCCCGDALIKKATDFNTTSMIFEQGLEYTKEQLDEKISTCGVAGCKCKQLFTSNRQEGCTTVQDFYDKRFERKTSPFSPKYQYTKDN